MAEVSNFINFNGIPKKMAHEVTTKEGKTFYNVGIAVPKDFSDNGIANVSTNKIFPVKTDDSKINIGFPKDWEINASIKKGDKYETVKIAVKDLQSKHIDALKSIKASKEAKIEKESPTPDVEEDIER